MSALPPPPPPQHASVDTAFVDTAHAPAAVQATLCELGLQHNRLTGPAFPPTWLAPDSKLNLRRLQISYNPGLSGRLPPALNWSKVELL